MRRVWRWLIRIVFAAALAISAWWAVQQFVLPRVVHDRIIAALESIGLDGSAARIERLGADRTLISNLIIGSSDLLTIESAEITYDLREAARGKVRTIRLTAAWLRLAVRDGALDLGQLERIDLGDGGPDAGLTFDRIELRASNLLIDLPDRSVFVPITGSIVRADDGYDVDLASNLIDRELSIAGRVRFDGGAVAAEQVRVQVSASDLPLTAWGWTLRDTGFTLNVDATLADGRLTVALREGSRVTAAGTNWQLAPAYGMPLLVIDPGAEDSTVIAARFESTAALTLGDDESALTIGRASGDALIRLGGAQPYRVNAAVVVEQTAARHAPTGLRIDGIRATIPITFNTALEEAGVFTFNQIALGDDTLPPMIGTIRFADGRLRSQAEWKIVGPLVASLSLEATADDVRFAAVVPPAALDSPHTLADAFTAFEGVELTGTVGASVDVRYRDGALEPRAVIDLADASVGSEAFGLSIDGLAGRVVFDRLDPLSTSSNQRFTAESITLGKVDLHDATAAFRIESPDTVFIERAAWTLGSSGRMRVHAIRFDVDEPVIETDVFIEELNLGDWLSVLTDEAVSATGTLYGRVPVGVRFVGDRPLLDLGRGFLHAESGGGTLRFRDASTVGNLLAEADPRFAPGGQLSDVRRDATAALSDFAYDMFRFDLVEDSDGEGLMLRVQTRGKGRTGAQQEIGGLNINLHNFDEAANFALFAKLGVQERIGRSLDRFFGGPTEPGAVPRTPREPVTDDDFNQFFE